MRVLSFVLFGLFSVAAPVSAQSRPLPTPDAYQVDPGAELDSGGPEALPAPPTVSLERGALPPGYEPFPTPSASAHLEVVDWGGGPFRLELTATEPGAQPQDICVSPCVRDIEPGRYRVAIGNAHSGTRNADDAEVYLSRGVNVLQIHYDHRVGERSLGWTALLFGASLGAALAPLGPVVAIIFTPTLLGLGLVVGLPLIFLEDSARFEIYQPAEQPDPR